MTPVRAIRQKCLDCSNGSAVEVRQCPVNRCVLHPFRLGRNPNRKPMSPEKRAQLAGRFLAGKAIAGVLLCLVLASCASGPQMPTEPFQCFDAFGKSVPCVEEMDCHEEPKGKEL